MIKLDQIREHKLIELVKTRIANELELTRHRAG